MSDIYSATTDSLSDPNPINPSCTLNANNTLVEHPITFGIQTQCDTLGYAGKDGPGKPWIDWHFPHYMQIDRVIL